MAKIVVTKGNAPAKQPAKAKMPAMSDEKAWMAREDLRTLQRAEEIRKDASRIKAAKCEAQCQIKALDQITKK